MMLSSSSSGKEDESLQLLTSSTVRVDTPELFANALEDLYSYNRFAFDTEGVNLGRSGDLTIATIQGIPSSGDDQKNDEKDEAAPQIYVIDVQLLGGDTVFSKDTTSLRSLLEDESKQKLAFDCRADSDALYHQFDVTLRGTIDLQVFDQAVRIHNGELPPKKNVYVVNDGTPFLDNMGVVSERYSTKLLLSKHDAPHRLNNQVWKERPLSLACANYAAHDVYLIEQMWKVMANLKVSKLLMDRAYQHSQRYESMFRDRVEKISQFGDKLFIMEEHPIISEHELPTSHPRRLKTGGVRISHTVEKWNKAVTSLETKSASAFNDATFILQHNDWYTDAGRIEIRRLAAACPFTTKQRNRINNPVALERDDSDDDYYGYDHGYHSDNCDGYGWCNSGDY